MIQKLAARPRGGDIRLHAVSNREKIMIFARQLSARKIKLGLK